MGIFARIYTKTLTLSEHKHAANYLAIISFAESLFMPVPIDLVLSAMMLSKPQKSYQMAIIATFFSLLGGLLAYTLGATLFEPLIKPLLIFFNSYEAYEKILSHFSRFGFLVMLIAGLIPIPYKLFTLSAGVMRIALPLFILAAIIGRGTRFFLLALLLQSRGEIIRHKVHQISDWLGWGVLLCIIIIVLLKIF